jgi:hypothetical protein
MNKCPAVRRTLPVETVMNKCPGVGSNRCEIRETPNFSSHHFLRNYLIFMIVAAAILSPSLLQAKTFRHEAPTVGSAVHSSNLIYIAIQDRPSEAVLNSCLAVADPKEGPVDLGIRLSEYVRKVASKNAISWKNAPRGGYDLIATAFSRQYLELIISITRLVPAKESQKGHCMLVTGWIVNGEVLPIEAVVEGMKELADDIRGERGGGTD